MNVSELSGVLLDYWTARADGRTVKILKPGERINSMPVRETMCAALTPGYEDWWQPFHVYYGSAAPIIEREKIATTWAPFAGRWYGLMMGTTALEVKYSMTGETPWIAAMRVYVASKYGAEVPDAG